MQKRLTKRIYGHCFDTAIVAGKLIPHSKVRAWWFVNNPRLKHVGLSLTGGYRRGRDVWPIDCGPTPNTDVQGSVGIGVSGMTARYTHKGSLVFAVSTVNTATSIAGFRGVTRIDEDKRNAMQLGFVFNLGTKIMERPSIMLTPLCFANRYPFTDARQVFQGDTATGVFRTFNNLLGDLVVYVFGKTLLFARALFQQTLGRFRTFALQLSAQLEMAFAQAINFISGVLLPVTIAGNVLNAQINAQEVINIFRCWLVDFTGGKQVELTVDQAKVGFATVAAQKFFGPIMADKREMFDTPIYRPNGNRVLIQIPGQDTAIKSDRSKWLKFPLDSFVQLVSVRHFGNAANDELGGQVKDGFDFMVNQLLDLELTKHTVSPSNIADEITGTIRCFECSLQAIRLRFGWYKFDLCR